MCGLWPELFFCDSDAAGLCHPLRTFGAVAEGQKPPLFSSFSPSFSFILLFWTNAIENGSRCCVPTTVSFFFGGSRSGWPCLFFPLCYWRWQRLARLSLHGPLYCQRVFTHPIGDLLTRDRSGWRASADPPMPTRLESVIVGCSSSALESVSLGGW